jgi:hypothetical protein
MRRLRVVRAAMCAGVLASVIGGAPARAADTGTIEGVVVNRTTGEPASGVGVRLAGGGDEGPRVERTAVTSSAGRFRFRGLPTGAERLYALDAQHDGGLFAGGVIRLPANTSEPPVVDTRMSVWDTTTDPSSIVLARDMLFVVPNTDSVGVVESVRINNVSHKAYIGRGAEQENGGGRMAEEAAPSLAFSLPAGADLSGVRIIDATIDIPRIRASELGFVTTVAIPPGVTAVTFTYPLEGATGQFDLTKRALYPTVDYAVHAAPPLEITGDALQATGEIEIGGQTYTRYEAPGPLEAGDVAEALTIAQGTRDPILVGGLVAIAVGLVAAIAFGLVRRRRPRAGLGRAAEETRDGLGRAAEERAGLGRGGLGRDDLVTAIAELDLAHEVGSVDRAEWSARRTELKQRLAALQEPQAAP